MARVKLEQVRKVYDDGAAHIAVHGIDLEVGDGELVVLVGPSGCGKSTTLRMIAGLESISAGTLWIGDRVVNDLPPKDRDIAMVFQNYALYPHMSVYDNMAFALKLRKLPKAEIESRVRQAADILGLQGVLDRRPKQLSGGQRQRVAVGRAIVRQPQVFLFDEPLSNLDAKLRVQTRREIAKLHRELAATMVYVTHDQVEAMTMGDRIVVMHEGRVQQIDTPLGLYDRPVNRFVAGFIGSPAMNFVSGVIARANGGLTFRAEGDGITLPIPEPAARVLASRDGAAMLLGIRPEHIAVAGTSGLTSSTATGTVRLRLDAVEPMGNEIILYGRAGAHDLTSRVPPQPLPEPGDAVELAVDLSKLHFFDPATEMVIAQPGAAGVEPRPAE
ncbi:MAG: sn-glycerol-3-phosphate ABC transporter ATP-binding protein UgpC [Gemmatimonadota bacterium]|nr:sn-glycerol-3-phosphate ABC transporter ATP-binding protein UgpC [Gemmatimonadota bacterium]